jgi:hypothetical protein
MCRRSQNQFRAKQLWEEIKPNLPQEFADNFVVEWNHYLIAEITPEEFAQEISKISKKLRQ